MKRSFISSWCQNSKIYFNFQPRFWSHWWRWWIIFPVHHNNGRGRWFFGTQSQEALPTRCKYRPSVGGGSFQGSKHYKAAKVSKKTEFEAEKVSFQWLLMWGSFIFTGWCTSSKREREKLRSKINRQQCKQDPDKYLKILKQNRIRYLF